MLICNKIKIKNKYFVYLLILKIAIKLKIKKYVEFRFSRLFKILSNELYFHLFFKANKWELGNCNFNNLIF